MNVLFMFIIALVCYGVLIGIVIFSFILFKRTKDLNPLLAKREELLSDIRTASSTLDELRSQNNELRNEATDYQSIIAEGEKAKEFLENNGGTIEGAEKAIADLKQRIEEANRDYSAISEKIDDANEELQELKAQEQNAELGRRHAEEEKKYAEEKLATLESDIEIKTKELNDIKADIVSLESKKREYDALLVNIGEAKATLSKLEEQIEKLKKELSDLEIDASFVKGQVAEYKGKLNGIKGGDDVWGTLDTPLITDKAFATLTSGTSREIEEIQWLKDFEEYLKKCDIKFDSRTINAFHTSLKVADSSPLVVLAGISGTGKSLLPQLYAKFFGFNFLNMAIQPRWDSPQDLFGFYNYAQFSYKATELSRLLWQYDVYNNENCAFKDYPDQLPMNIVLLDEMNLARIEYYFSDMLSKLETRRTIVEKNESSRRLAEVEIECGSNESKHLFVGSNTLFVGTMNEDETTQALSDKVMDRANVLRFGRPKDLEAKADSKKFEKDCASNIPLTIKEWKSLSNNKNNSFDDELAKTINKLNDAMEIAGRPFAHRIKMAMTNYIKNYPGIETGENYKHALSDQIEFKIMPKLNGIEKSTNNNQDALNRLGDIIGDIDSKLYEEFKKCIDDSDSAFFQWHGVRR